MRFRSKIDKNYIIKVKDIKSLNITLCVSLVEVKNRKYIDKYINICFISKYKKTKEEIKQILQHSTYIIQAYDEILKERYDIEVY